MRHAAALSIAATLAAAAPAEELRAAPTPPGERLVGIAYTTWHRDPTWADRWGTPQLGLYDPKDRAVIREHARETRRAGVDFLWVDWSNNVDYVPLVTKNRPDFDLIEESTWILFDELASMPEEERPRISIFIGCTGHPDAVADGRLQRKADQVHEWFVEEPRFRPLLQDHLGKPLLVVYVNTPTPWPQGVPEWDDPRFTVRWMTGFITQQPYLLEPGTLHSQFGYWSWEDRGAQTYTTHDGQAEAMVVTAAWRKDTGAKIPEQGRRGGLTLHEAFARAREVGPKFAMVVSWNEWVRGEQPSVEVSKDIEPSKEHGRFYVELLAREIAAFKGQAPAPTPDGIAALRQELDPTATTP